MKEGVGVREDEHRYATWLRGAFLGEERPKPRGMTHSRPKVLGSPDTGERGLAGRASGLVSGQTSTILPGYGVVNKCEARRARRGQFQPRHATKKVTHRPV